MGDPIDAGNKRMTNSMLRIVPHVFNAAFVWILLVASAFPMWEESEIEQNAPAVRSPKNTETVNSSDQKVHSRGQRDVSIGFLLLLIIGIVGVTFAIMVVMWGSQVRRIARNRVSRPTLVDPLWYLKPKKRRVAPERTDSEASNPENSKDESS